MPAYGYSQDDLKTLRETGIDPHHKPVYQINLILDDTVIDAGHSTNCKHALHGAYESLAGIPQAECCIRRNGQMVAWMHTNFRGDIDEIETHFRRDSVVLPLNPKWLRWPGFVNTPKGTAKTAILVDHKPQDTRFYFVQCKTFCGPFNVAVKSDANTTIFEALCQEALKRGLIIECGSLRILEEITEEEFLDLT